MKGETRFTIGVDARCCDGHCGEVIRVVVDPVAQTITHLVVEPKHQIGLGRLVPLDLLDVAESGEVRMHCTLAEFDNLESAEETEFLPGGNGYEGYGADQVLTWPYYRLGLSAGYGGVTLGYARERVRRPDVWKSSQLITHDAIPLGDVAVRRGGPVHATDGDIGKVQGLVIDPRTHHVTHVLLQEGHVFGRKEVAIPITAVVGIDGGIRLNLTTAEVEDLPPVNVDRAEG